MKSKNLLNNLKTGNIVQATFVLLVGPCLIYNLYVLFFPISSYLEFDGAEHLHAAYLLSIGERPYLDFIQNHPMLFNHFLLWIERFFNIAATRDLANTARTVIFIHFLLCLIIFCLWTTRQLAGRTKGIAWAAMLIAAWAVLDIFNAEFHWMWEIRPDFICYGYTLSGLYLIYNWMASLDKQTSHQALIWAVAGGFLIGFGNAILPKGFPFIAAFGLSFLTIAILDVRGTFEHRMNLRNIGGALIIVSSLVLSFIIWVAVDCYLSKVSVAKWISAVFVLNSRKHLIFTNSELNPMTTLLNMFSVPLPVALMLIGWIAWELINLEKPVILKNKFISVWLFALYTIAANLILPTYSTGVTWSYYFIPSLFSAATICLILLIRLKHCLNHHPVKKQLTLLHGLIIVVAAIFVIQIVNNPMHAFMQIGARKVSAEEIHKLSPKDYILESRLPKDFVYFGYPVRIPVKSRSWGYYFMLNHSTNFWKDCYTLGLGPDPEKVWGRGFGNNPPDAIAFSDYKELAQFVFITGECQQIDISWLFDEIREHYVLMGNRLVSLYVRKDRTPRLKSQGWRELHGFMGVEN